MKAVAVVLCVVAMAQTPRRVESTLELRAFSFRAASKRKKRPGFRATESGFRSRSKNSALAELTSSALRWISAFAPPPRTSRRAATLPWIWRTYLPIHVIGAKMRYRRVLSVTMIPPTRMKGWAELQDYLARAPKDGLERFSPLALRIKAKVTFTRTPDDDDFRVLEILSVPKL